MNKLLDISHKLLYKHDCLIVPGLGGFITQQKPAYWDIDRWELHPSRKTLAFNALLNQNDGLLAKELELQNSISYDEALVEIQSWSNAIKHQISTQGHCHLQGLGTFYSTEEDSPVFVPEPAQNFDSNQYGLYKISLRSSFAKTSSKPTKRRMAHQESVSKKAIAPKDIKSRNVNLNLINVLGSVFILAMVFSVLNMELGPNKDLPYLSQYLDSSFEHSASGEQDGIFWQELLQPKAAVSTHSILLNGTFSSTQVEKIVSELDQLYIQNEIIELENKQYQISVISFTDKQLANRYRDLLQKRIPYKLTITAK